MAGLGRNWRRRARRSSWTAVLAALAGAGLVLAGSVVAPPGSLPAASAITSPACVSANGDGHGSIRPSSTFVVPRLAWFTDTNGAYRPFTQEAWNASLARLKDAGLSSVIVQATAYSGDFSGTHMPYFPNRDASGDVIYPETPSGQGYSEATLAAERDQLHRILEAARLHGMTVTVGLGLAESEWFEKPPTAPEEGWRNVTWLTRERDRAVAAGNAIWDTFGKASGPYQGRYASTIDGWYLPYELEGYELADFVGGVYRPTPERAHPYVDTYLKGVSQALVSSSGKKRVVVSPLFTADSDDPGSTAEQNRLSAWKDVWQRAYSTTDLSVVAPQDGAGSGKVTAADLARWIGRTEEARVAAGSSGVEAGNEVWGNAENYRDQNEGIDHMGMRNHAQNLAAMKAGGASTLVTFSLHRIDDVAGHAGAGTNALYRDAFAAWMSGEGCPATALSAPRSFAAVTGSGAAGQDESTTVRLTWDQSTTSTVSPGRKVAGYLVLRDGRRVGEYAAPTAAGEGMTHLDYQMQPGRTYTYQVYAYDAWGTYSPAASAVDVTVPWTAAALAARDGGPGDFNVARNAPYAITSTATGTPISADGIDERNVTDELTPSPAYDDPVATPGDIGHAATPTAPKVSATYAEGAATDTVLATNGVFDGRWQGQFTESSGYWAIRIDLTAVHPGGVPVRQVNTQWGHDPAFGVSAPTKVQVQLVRAGNAGLVDLGAQRLPDADRATKGAKWYHHQAATQIENVTAVLITVDQQGGSWAFLGEAQAMDDGGTNSAARAPYLLQDYNSDTDLTYDPWNPDGTVVYAGTRAWSVTDGTAATRTTSQPENQYMSDPAWTGRITSGSTYLTLDLGARQRDLTDITLGTYHRPGAAIRTPGTARIRVAGPDNAWPDTWSAPVTLTTPTGSGYADRVVQTIPVPADRSTARFVQIHLTTTPGQYLFLDEVEVHTRTTTNSALDRPVTHLNRSAGLCSGTTCRGAAALGADLGVLTSAASFTTTWNGSERWAMTLVPDLDDPTIRGTTYEVDLAGGTGQPNRTITEVTTTWLEDYDASVVLPATVTVQYRNGAGGTWHTLGTAHQPAVPQEIPRLPLTWTYRTVPTAPVTATAIRVRATNSSIKPWTGAGPAWVALASVTTQTPG